MKPSSPPGVIHHPRGARLRGGLLGASLFLAACSGGEPGSTSAPGGGSPPGLEGNGSVSLSEAPVAGEIPAGSREVRRRILDLITALTPLPATTSAGEQNAWFPRRKETLEQLRAAGPEVGREALRVYLESDQRIEEVRGGLLDVAAHGVPEETRKILVDLIEQFGPPLGLRTEACMILARTSPETACSVLAAILREERPRVTYPPQERMLNAWDHAARSLGIDRAELLCDLATDLRKDPDARTKAAKFLGEFESPVGRQALEVLLVESTGNHYLRRIAAQSLQKTIPAPELVAMLQEVLAKESDPNFAQFLASMIERNHR